MNNLESLRAVLADLQDGCAMAYQIVRVGEDYLINIITEGTKEGVVAYLAEIGEDVETEDVDPAVYAAMLHGGERTPWHVAGPGHPKRGFLSVGYYAMLADSMLIFA